MINFWNNIFITTLRMLPFGSIQLIMPNKKKLLLSGKKNGPKSDIIILKNSSIKKIMTKGSIGLGEEFIKGNIKSSDLSNLMHYLALNNDYVENKIIYSKIFKIINFIRHFLNKNTKYKAKKNIMSHYDLGNIFYKFWLDQSMTYSSAIFENKKMSLYKAQLNKYKKIINLAEINKEDQVLEIGCGWGGFVEFLNKSRECSITATTISNEQYLYTKKRMKKLKIKNNIEILNTDYRDLKGKFDKIVSIEMFEAVGFEYWDIFFKKLKNLIKSNGIITLQIITIKDDVFDYYKKNPDFIQKYIFPGGMLPSFNKLKAIIKNNGLKIESIDSYPNDYAYTLSVWRKNFNRSYPSIKNLGFDQRFHRLWNFYLAYCEGGFKSRHIDLNQIKIKPN